MPVSSINKQTANAPVSAPPAETPKVSPQKTGDSLQNIEADTHPPVGQHDAASLSAQIPEAQLSHVEHAEGGLGDVGAEEHAEVTRMMTAMMEDPEPLDAAGIRSMLHTLTESPELHLMNPQETDDIRYAGNYLLELDKDMGEIAQLVDKFNADGLNEGESAQLNGLLKTHKYNMALLQTWLGEKGGAFQSPTARAMAEVLSDHIADRHVELADAMAMCVDGLPETEAVSRSNTIQHGLINAKSMSHALQNLHRYAPVKDQYIGRLAIVQEQLSNLSGRLQKLLKMEQGPSGADTGRPLAEQMQSSRSSDEHVGIDLSRKSAHARSPKELAKTKAGKELIQHWDRLSQARSREPYLPVSVKGMSSAEMISLFTDYSMKKSPGYDKKDWSALDFACQQSKVHVLNEKNPGAWQKLEKSVGFPYRGKHHVVTSMITPAGAQQGKGVCSGDRITQTRKIPNLAQTQVKDMQGRVLFKGFRHGILTPYKLTGKNIAKLPKDEISKMLSQAKKDSAEVRQMLSGLNEKELAGKVKKDKKLAENVANAVRITASDNMTKSLIAEAASADSQIVKRALRGETPTVALDSISLVSPDLLRGKKPSKSERDMLITQKEALAAARGEQQIQVRDPEDGDKLKTVKVKVEINALNFGVNRVIAGREGRFNRSSKLGKAVSGWGFSIAMNEPALNNLLGDLKSDELGGQAAARLEQLNTLAASLKENIALSKKTAVDATQLFKRREGQDSQTTQAAVDLGRSALGLATREHRAATDELARVDKEINILNDLARQIKTMAKDQSYISDGHEPYKMVSRLALLSNKLGHTTAFNCKSGKDRTGQLDAEVKYLATVADLSGRVPEPNQQPGLESQKAKTQFALHSGNLEMQAYNTGLPGYKTKLASLKKQFEADAWPLYRGGSDQVSS